MAPVAEVVTVPIFVYFIDVRWDQAMELSRYFYICIGGCGCWDNLITV
jgi:hypothetical protein